MALEKHYTSGAQATFNAGVKITLSPGFYAQSGSYFHTVIAGAPLDSDGDGIPDYWEIQYGLNPNNAADAALDPNGNGLNNLQEYAAGNNPLPSSLTYELHYDTNQRGQLTAIKKADNTPLVVYTYLADQRRASRWLSNNTQTDYGYDGAGRMNLLDNYRVPDSSEIQKQEYGYDSRDRRTWTQRDGNLGDTYAYQADSQLTDFKLNASNPRATPSGWTQEVSYAYDPVGNRTGVTNNGAFTSYSVDHANQYTAVTGATVQYGDGRGNVTQWNAWTYTYDADNRMLSASKSGTSITFAYDPTGRLVKRVTNGQTEFFCYDGAQQLMRTDQNATLLSSTIWGPNPDEVLIDTTPQNGNRYFHSDIQGTTLAVTDDSRVVLERYRYDPYGTTTFYDASWNVRSATAYNVRFLYTGQERMSAADGLYNYKNRFYSVELGRFLQCDPSRLKGDDLNLFRYVRNECMDRTDSTGLYEEDVHLILTTALAMHAGFSREDAQAIGRADQGVDDSSKTGPFVSEEARRDYHFTTEVRRETMRQEAFNEKTLDKMGQYLHAEQDSFAHQKGQTDRDGEKYGAKIGHLMDGHAPDKTHLRPELALKMAKRTYDELRAFKEAKDGIPVQDEWKKLERIIRPWLSQSR